MSFKYPFEPVQADVLVFQSGSVATPKAMTGRKGRLELIGRPARLTGSGCSL